MTDVILVHGAGTGGWLWDDVAALLRAEGHRVLTPTLRGVGAPATRADRDVDLSTHIDAVVQLAEVEELGRLALVGFSYGGFVVAGAAARLGDRITQVIYLDALVPQPGRSFFDLLPEPARAAMKASATVHGDGLRIPPAPLEMVGGIGAHEPGVDLDHVHTVLARRGFHPMAAYEEPFPAEPTLASVVSQVFVSCTDKPPGDPLLAFADRLRAIGWPVETLPTGHFSMLSMPRALSDLLLDRLA